MTSEHSASKPISVAIVGGGCAALTTAFELTRPELAGRYSVTVYQMGWRLGGKGASGRGAFGRIEEHGLHLWMGYYENAFRIMRECYAEVASLGDGSLRFEEAFLPAHFNAAMDRSPTQGWVPWKVDFPPTPGLPGDPFPPRLSVLDYLVRAAQMARTLLATLPTELAQTEPSKTGAGQASGRAGDFVTGVSRLLRVGALVGVEALLEALGWLELGLSALPSTQQSLVSRLLELITVAVRAELAKWMRGNDEARRLAEVLELILASIRGSIRFRLAFDPRGFDAIDDYDCREWLRMNGASEAAINSAFIRALYDLAFAYEKGDPSRPAIAAGSAMRGAFRAFFSYRGAFFWKMGAGMGDIVFAPLYRVLQQRGVRFEFFHKLDALTLSEPGAESPHVRELVFDVQARTHSGAAYQPLVDIKRLACWPSEPDFSQLVDGDALKSQAIDFESQWDRRGASTKRLRVGEDFDFVVLGVGLGVIGSVCRELIARDERWSAMVQRVQSVPTQAFQLWLDKDVAALGWKDRAVNLSGFVEPFDTWADMSHVANNEDWALPPKSIAYFCNVLEDGGEPAAGEFSAFVSEAYDRVRANAVAFLEGDMHHLWPAARTSFGGFDWTTLSVRDHDVRGPERLRTQYWTANVRPSDRYSQALPGSTRFRISPLDRSYDNLTVAGDWTNCGINMGCVEAAVMSGMLAANALSGAPTLEAIVGYDHP